MDFTFRPLTEQIGAKIIGIDLRQPISKSAMAKLREIWLDHTILHFPGQDLNDDQQIAFSRRIGELELLNMSVLQIDGKPEIYTATNLDPNGNILPLDDPIMQLNADNAKWHSDSSFKKVPSMASLLHARVVPPVGGKTGFANMIAAYDGLEGIIKKRIDGLIGIHNFFWSRRGLNEVAFTDEEKAAIPPVRHPVVRVHPETGEKAIFVGSHTETIEGMKKEDARKLIDELITHSTQEKFVYEHQWQVGDLILWDNRSALHRGMGFDMENHKRRMHRTTIAGISTANEENNAQL